MTRSRRRPLRWADTLVGIAVAELRSSRRMVRTWLFGAIAVAIGASLYHGFGVGHLHYDGVAPRFALPGVGLFALCALLVGMIFVAFDARARDERAGLAETLDARLLSNPTLLAGRLLAAVLVCWLPVLVLALALWASGMVVARMQMPGGVVPEPVALLTFALLDAPVALALQGAVVAALVALLRSTWPAAAVALTLLGLYLYALFNTPLHLLPALSPVTNLGLAGSEILPRWPTAYHYAARAAALLATAGWLTVAAGASPRLEATPRARRFAIGLGLVALGPASVGALAWQAHAEHGERLGWREVHRDLADEPRLDIERIAGQANIEPGRRLSIRVAVTATVPAAAALDALRFSLNPGLRVDSVQVAGEPHAYRHEDGLLTVTLANRPAPGQRVVVAIEAEGVPDQRFGYLDSAIDAMGESLLGRPLALLGEQASLFDEEYVALLPTVRWLPLAGANYHAPADFFDLDLEVALPVDWLAAGAGRAADAGGRRFAPRAPIEEFALIAAPFERVAMTFDGVVAETLMHPKHMPQIQRFAAAAEQGPSGGDASSRVMVVFDDDGNAPLEDTRALASHLRDRLRTLLLSDGPFAYPHDVFSLVEIPAQLRRYRGGWSMDAAQAFPGIQLMAEHGFPTSRLVDRPQPPQFPAGQWSNYLFVLAEYAGPFGVPITLGNTRHVLPTRASGDGAAAVDQLMTRLTSNSTNWRTDGDLISALWLSVGSAPRPPPLWWMLERAMATATMASGWHTAFPMRIEDESEKLSFTGFDPATMANGAHILIHKSSLVAAAIERLLGREKTLRLLALMRERHGGGTFALAEFERALIDVDATLEPFIRSVLRGAALPGFLASDAQVQRLRDDAAGRPRYQIRVQVRNDEPSPGVAGIGYSGGDGRWRSGPFAHVPGESSVALGVVSAELPRQVRLETYLSLNRRPLQLRVPPVETDAAIDEPPFVGVQATGWLPPVVGIVVDDLDAGFATVSPPARWGLGAFLGADSRSLGADEDALPELRADAPAMRGWYRAADAEAVVWGKYRRTLAVVLAGDGDAKAAFSATLPRAGRWRLHYHLPGPDLSRSTRRYAWWHFNDEFGEMAIAIAGERDGDAREVAFDAASATPGWNSLGVFELSAGPRQVVVTNATTGDLVVADAVRWEWLGDLGSG